MVEPHEAVQDVMEINFGFEVVSIAGVAVNPQAQEEEKKEEKKESPEEEAKTKKSEGEFSAMKQEELQRERVL